MTTKSFCGTDFSKDSWTTTIINVIIILEISTIHDEVQLLFSHKLNTGMFNGIIMLLLFEEVNTKKGNQIDTVLCNFRRFCNEVETCSRAKYIKQS
ncbi:CLUMA_CG008569, isoform A [Clunio marinus]|uniref:CLUMA_CG008569, isoform A n=1 Tax=Clunio marinus TaxID=568069 RepID=A0A1J1I4H0_9DIPT|nr:CLUMA_CG008569, isoform A [Clunio marinus]